MTMDEYDFIEEHQTFRGFTDSQGLLGGNQNFEMLKGDQIHAKLPLGWKKGFDSGIVML